MITVQEWETAAAAGKIEFTRQNKRPVRCARQYCRRLCGEGQARRVFLDGHARGFGCQACQWSVVETTRRQ